MMLIMWALSAVPHITPAHLTIYMICGHYDGPCSLVVIRGLRASALRCHASLLSAVPRITPAHLTICMTCGHFDGPGSPVVIRGLRASALPLTTAAAIVVVAVVAAASPQNDQKNDNTAAAVAAEETVIVTHNFASFRLHLILCEDGDGVTNQLIDIYHRAERNQLKSF